jgi:Trypsin-like peptidase domain
VSAAPTEHAIGIDPRQIAEVLVVLPGGAARRGSGYRVGGSAVLTAAHVVAGAESVRVRFDADRPGEWCTQARRIVADTQSDVAAIVMDPPPGSPFTAPAFGQVDDAANELMVHAVGFPRFKLKAYEQPGAQGVYRDSHQATGTVAALSNRRSGTFEVTVRAPERDPDPMVSPWEGMSGAALWAGGRIIGVVTDHHRSDGLARLAATRLDRLVQRAIDDSEPAVTELLAVLGLPSVPGELPRVDALPVPGHLVTSYHHQVDDIAPERLLGRDAELAELVAFAAGDESYGWWHAEAWAGKTALMAWFALHPPPDVDVVAFFVASALAGQSDSEAFLEATSEQLTFLSGHPPGAPSTTAARHRNLLPLLESTAHRCRDSGRRLVLVVDGLDEDTSAETGKASIASLLPRRPPEGVRVVVTSRPDRQLPLDVPADHPLHRCHRRSLRVSPHAHHDEVFARRELRERLHAGALPEDLLGLITASGGGIGRNDLAELTNSSPFAIDELLRGTLGHTVGTRVQRLAGSEGSAGERRGYLLGHRTLREIAEQDFGARLGRYRQRVHAWADGYRRDSWPKDTPLYLLRDYPRMLAMVGDDARLTALAADADRHDRMLDITGGDALALDEIALAQSVNRCKGDPDLVAAVLLAMRREELVRRNTEIPVRLPAVWASIGRFTRAEALARGIPRPGKRAAAMAGAAVAAAATGRVAQAEQLAAGIDDPEQRDLALAGVAAATARHDVDRAVRIARRMEGERRDSALVRIASAVAFADPERATDLVAEIAASPHAVNARVAAAVAAVAAGDAALAESTLDEIEPASRRARAWAALAAALAVAGHIDQAELIAQHIRRSGLRLQLLAQLTRAAVDLRDDAALQRLLVELRQAARGVPHRGDAIEVLIEISGALRRCGRAEDAAALDADAEYLTTQLTDSDQREWATMRLAVARAGAGDPRVADEMIERLPDPDHVAKALSSIALTAARDGRLDRAESAIRRIPAGRHRMHALTDVAAAIAEAGREVRASVHAAEVERMARRTSDPRRLAVLAARVAEGLTTVGDREAARRLAERISDVTQRGSVLTRVAEACADSGDIATAEEIAGSLSEPERRTWVLVSVCAAHGAAGRRREAIDAASAATAGLDRIDDRYSRVVALIRLYRALRAVGADADAERVVAVAGRVVDDIADPSQRARALAQLAIAAADAGDQSRADDLDKQLEDALLLLDGGRRDRVLARMAQMLAEAGRAEQAGEVAVVIVDPARRVRALAAAAGATRDGGRAWALLSRAEADLELIGDPDERAGALGRLAGSAVAVLEAGGAPGPSDQRRIWLRKLVAELLVSDAWIEVVPVIAWLDRAAFDAVVEWLAARVGVLNDDEREPAT